MNLGPIRASLFTWSGYLGDWTCLQRIQRLKTADTVPYLPVPTLTIAQNNRFSILFGQTY